MTISVYRMFRWYRYPDKTTNQTSSSLREQEISYVGKASEKGVCDSNLKFMDISCGWPGSMHDSRIFEMSSLSRVIEEKLRDTNYHLLGDSAYRLGIRLITPYRDNGHLTPVNIFNRKIIGF